MKEYQKLNLEAYNKLNHNIVSLIQCLKNQLRDVRDKKKDPTSEAWRLVYQGQEISLQNAIVDLELAHERAHYHIKFKKD